MNIYAVVATRNEELKPITSELLSYLASARVKVHTQVGFKSIFEAYQSAVDEIKPDPEDVMIFCHDDIKILMPAMDFLKQIIGLSAPADAGFVGVAGTAKIGTDPVWWDKDNMSGGFLHGRVWHGEDWGDMHLSNYSAMGRAKRSSKLPARAVVMDGLFLACRGSVLEKISLTQPEEFEGAWDFYDIYYTLQAHQAGFKNIVAPIMLMHNSPGDLTGRDSWHKNKDALAKMFPLPTFCPRTPQ